MNTRSILASLVFGASLVSSLAAPSLAAAAPAATVAVTAQGAFAAPCETPVAQPVHPKPVIQPIGWNGGGHTLPPVYRTVTLASAQRFGGDGKSFIAVGSQAGQFRTLQINGTAGRPLIKQVFVQFGNGQTQVLRNLDRVLTPGQSLTLDLDGNRRNISRIVVYGSDNAGWRRTAGAFSVTAS